MAKSLRGFFFAAVILLGSTSVFAQSARVFVSGSGNDLNPCSLTSPCRSFSHAITQVTSGGEIIPLDSAGYGAVVIDRSVSIAAPEGIYAGVTTATGIAITISGSSLNVFLRGLTINGTGADYGVYSGGDGNVVRMERLNVANFASMDVFFGGSGSVLLMSDCTLSNSRWGVYVSGNSVSAIARATLDHLRGTGFNYLQSLGSLAIAAAFSLVTVRDSVSTANFRGFEVYDSGVMELENCVASHNVVGVFGAITTSGNPVMYVSNSVITFNTLYGIEAHVGANIYSRANNTVVGNPANEAFSGQFLAN